MLHLSHEGSWIGYGAAVRGQPLRVTTVARTNVLFACVPWRAMQELLHDRPDWWQFIARACLEYGDIAISGYADSLIADSDRRCACTLLRIAGLKFPRRSRPERRSVPITQDELATLVNVSRTTLPRENSREPSELTASWASPMVGQEAELERVMGIEPM